MTIHPICYPNNKKGLHIVELVFIILASLFYINFEFHERYALQSPFIALGYIFFCYIREKEQQKLILRFLIVLFLFSALNVLLTDGNSVGASVSNRSFKRFYAYFSQYELVFFPIFMYHRVMKLVTKKQFYIIMGTTLTFALILISQGITIARINENVLHSMNAETLEAAGTQFIGFSYVYSFTFVILTCIMIYSRSDSKMVKMLMISLITYCGYFLLTAQFALSIVTTFISLLYLFYTITKNKDTRLLVILVIIIIAFILPIIVNFLIGLVGPGLLQERLTEIYNSLTGNVDNNSDLYGRLELYWMCVLAFLNSPIWGNRALDFNGHSTFLTAFADLGLLGGPLLVMMFVYSYRFMKSSLGKNTIYYKPLMFQIVLMGLTNPIHSAPSNFIMLYFLCPLAITYFINNNYNHIKYVSKSNRRSRPYHILCS